MTATEIITQAKLLTRQNTTDADTLWLSRLNTIQRNYSRREDWPQLRVMNATLTTVANQTGYDLPSNFERLLGDFVTYGPDVVTGGYQSGSLVRVLQTGDPQIDKMANIWGFTGGGLPAIGIIGSKTGVSNTLQLNFYPFPQLAATSIVFSYYRKPTTLLVGTSVDVEGLSDTYIAALAREIEFYSNQMERAKYFSEMEHAEYNMYLRTFLPT